MASIGDVVYLKSGGPAMTVSGNPDGPKVSVRWMVGGGVSEDSFASAMLTADNPAIVISHANAKAQAALDVSDPIAIVQAKVVA